MLFLNSGGTQSLPGIGSVANEDIFTYDPSTERLFVTNTFVDVHPDVEGLGGIDVLDISGAGAQAAQVNVGIVISASAAADASGTMRVGNALALGGGFLQAGQIFNSAAGSSGSGGRRRCRHGPTTKECGTCAAGSIR